MFLAASLSGNAQSVLADIDKTKRKDYKSICEAFNRRFGTAPPRYISLSEESPPYIL
jgi:hypothetical protein